MDDAKTALFSLLLLLTLTVAIAASADVEYISPERQHELENLFESAQFSTPKDTQTLTSHAWKCDMYGVRTRLQVHRDLKLYKWTSNVGDWHNDGAQVVSEYKSGDHGLVGTRANFEDQVRVTTAGQIVSRLSLTAPLKETLAYSVCTSL